METLKYENFKKFCITTRAVTINSEFSLPGLTLNIINDDDIIMITEWGGVDIVEY